MFHGPLSAKRADRLAAELAVAAPRLLSTTAVAGESCCCESWRSRPARGVGVDIHGPDIARGRENADKRGLAERVTFIEGPAADNASKADVIINCGAYQAFGHARRVGRIRVRLGRRS